MTKATTNVARVAAAVAGLGLVAMSFAPMAGAQTSTTTTTTTTSSASFTRDLTVGSTGADVSALQTWLIGKGFSIPAGATGYFGMQTKAAVAAFQAANGITPAVGYFGPITRAKVASMGGSTGGSSVPGCMPGAAFSSTTGAPCGSGSSTGGSTGGLSGGEADLKNFSLNSGDDLMEGDSNKEIAVAKFDVRGGDVNVQRVTVSLQPKLVSSEANQHPWQYFDSLSVYAGGKKIGSVDASSKDAWDQETDNGISAFATSSDTYSIDISTNGVLKEGDNQELSIHADAVSNIDTNDQDQSFYLVIQNDDIRAIDSAGIQDYTGSDSDNVSVGFNAQQTGDLVVSAASDNPSSQVIVADDTDTSDSFDVLSFQIRNKDDVDVDFNKLTFTASTASSTSLNNVVRRATLDLDGDTYTGTIGSGAVSTITFDNLNTSVNGNDTINGTVSVELYGQTGHFSASGEQLLVSLPASGVDAESSDSGDTSDVTGTATGNVQSIGVNTGIMVSGNNNTATESYNSTAPTSSTGTFTVKFDVSANGNDVYIPRTIATTTAASSTAGVVLDANVGASTVGLSVPASLSSTADVDGTNAYYIVHDGGTETFTAQVTFDPASAGYYQVGLDKVRFNDSASLTGLQTLDVDQTKSENQTNQLYIH